MTRSYVLLVLNCKIICQISKKNYKKYITYIIVKKFYKLLLLKDIAHHMATMADTGTGRCEIYMDRNVTLGVTQERLFEPICFLIIG